MHQKFEIEQEYQAGSEIHPTNRLFFSAVGKFVSGWSKMKVKVFFCVISHHDINQHDIHIIYIYICPLYI